MNTKNANPVLDLYSDKIDKLEERLAKLNRAKGIIEGLRLLVVIAVIAFVLYLWKEDTKIIALTIFLGIVTFLFLIAKHTNYLNEIRNVDRLIQINQHEIDVINHNYYNFETGEKYIVPNHPYANDLDIFGRASLFQYINRCNAEQSRQLLGDRLLHGLNTDEASLQQEAVKELVTKTEWRHQFQAYGKANPLTLNTEKKIITWIEKDTDSFISRYWAILVNGYSVVALTALGLYIANVIPNPVFSLLVLLFTIIAFYFSKKINKTYLLLSKVVSEIETLYQQINWLEKEEFSSKKINLIKKSIIGSKQITVSKEIFRLKSILNRFDMRLNILVFFFLNIFLLWDLRQMIALNKWKKRNADTLPDWFKGIAEMEVLVSISSLAFNEREWCYPVFSDKHFTFEGIDIGHPIIKKETRICNSFKMDGVGKIALVTGSNMGGKSTFLRSVGVNTVMAMIGAPVCAKSFTLSPVKLMSSMRIADNLAESTSTFYAELKKLQQIIEEVNKKEKVFILLDEILRGTNSLDRHTGSKALIKQLIFHNAVGIIATHDVELAKVEEDFDDAITNYHFDVQVSANDELFFDYKLKEGVCKTLNASILMKKIGIEL